MASVELKSFKIECKIETYLRKNFFKVHKRKTMEEKIEVLENWCTYLEEATKGSKFSDWLEKTTLESHKEGCKHILECRIDDIYLSEIPDVNDYKHILDVYARYYAKVSHTVQTMPESLLFDL